MYSKWDSKTLSCAGRKKEIHSLTNSLLQQQGNKGPVTQTKPFLHKVKREESRERDIMDMMLA